MGGLPLLVRPAKTIVAVHFRHAVAGGDGAPWWWSQCDLPTVSIQVSCFFAVVVPIPGTRSTDGTVAPGFTRFHWFFVHCFLSTVFCPLFFVLCFLSTVFCPLFCSPVLMMVVSTQVSRVELRGAGTNGIAAHF